MIKPINGADKIINYWKKEKLIMACIAVAGICFNCGMVIGPIYQGKLIDSIVNGEGFNQTLFLAIVFILLICLIQIFRYFKRFYVRRFANKTSAKIRLIIYNNLMSKTLGQLENQNIGDLMTRAISDVDLSVEGMRKFTTEIFDTGVLMIAYYISLFVYDTKITLVCTVFIPVAIGIAQKLKSIVYKYSIKYRKKSSFITDIIYDYVDNAMLYRAYGMEADNRVRYIKQLEDLQTKAIKANILENSMQPIYNVVAMLGSVIVIYLGGIKAIDGGWTVGVFSAYFTIFTAMAVKASKAAKLFNSVQKAQVSWQRIKPYLNEYKTNDKLFIGINNKSTLLSVTNLCFRYPSSISNVIENISFSGTQGQIIGVTGPIASGKSGLGLALLGLYSYEGSIRIDGKELRDYTENERGYMLSYLGHNAQLFSDTIYNNITLGNKKDIASVLKDVCFDVDLMEMEDKENTLVGNSGIRLSGGQQARIALARALLNKNKLIILDDPFSAVDMKTEERIIDNLRNNYKQSLIIILSHRLTIFPMIDKVLFLHKDKTVDYGSHNELIKNSTEYKQIFELQCIVGEENNEK